MAPATSVVSDTGDPEPTESAAGGADCAALVSGAAGIGLAETPAATAGTTGFAVSVPFRVFWSKERFLSATIFGSAESGRIAAAVGWLEAGDAVVMAAG